MASLSGKVAIITGGSSGIGRATAIAFAREGAKVAIASRREEEGEETVRLVKEAGSDGFFVKTDVAKASDVSAMVEKTVQQYVVSTTPSTMQALKKHRLHWLIRPKKHLTRS